MSLTEDSQICPVCHEKNTVRSYTATVRGKLRTVLRCTVCNTGAVLA